MRTVREMQRYLVGVMGLLLVGMFISQSWGQATAVAPTQPAMALAVSEKPEFSFGIMTDVHVSDSANTKTRLNEEALPRLKAAVGELNKRDLAFVIQLGDFNDFGLVKIDEALEAFSQCKAPRYSVIGNHDVTAKDKSKVDMGEFNATVRKKHNVGKGYYDFEVKTSGVTWRMIVLDCMNEDKEQVLWFGEKLGKAAKDGEKVIVFRHYGPAGRSSKIETLTGANAEMVKLMEDSKCVIAYMNGHFHVNARRDAKGICYLTFQAMVEGSEASYGVVEVYRDHLEVIGVGKQPSVRVKFLVAAAVGG